MEKGTAIEKFVKYMLITNKSLTTIETYERDVRLFLLAIDVNEVGSITRRVIEEYFWQLARKETKNSVIKKKYASVKAFIKFLVEQGIIGDNPLTAPIKMPKNLTAKKVLVKRETIEEMLHDVLTNPLTNLRDKLIICLLLASGMSAVELVAYQRKDIKKITINQTLVGEIRHDIKTLLDNYLSTCSHDMLFISGRNQPLTHKYIRRLAAPFLKQVADIHNLDNFSVDLI